MLRYDRQTKPGLVALYDIRPGNGAGPFLQPRSRMGPTASRTWPRSRPRGSSLNLGLRVLVSAFWPRLTSLLLTGNIFF